MVEKLRFTWDKVHAIAEQLEHIQSDELIDKLDLFLGEPKFDPHGDPIPNKNGQYPTQHKLLTFNEALKNQTYNVAQVIEDDESLLSYLSKIGLRLNTTIKIIEHHTYNQHIEIEIITNKKNILLDKDIQQKIKLLKK